MKRPNIREKRRKDNPLYYDITYRIARTNTFKRDRYRCIIKGCKKPWIRITVHHIKPKSKYMELICQEDNMVTICRKHHVEVENGKHLKEIKEYMDRIYGTVK